MSLSSVVLEELAAGGAYEFCVVCATPGAVSFYERHGERAASLFDAGIYLRDVSSILSRTLVTVSTHSSTSPVALQNTLKIIHAQNPTEFSLDPSFSGFVRVGAIARYIDPDQETRTFTRRRI